MRSIHQQTRGKAISPDAFVEFARDRIAHRRPATRESSRTARDRMGTRASDRVFASVNVARRSCDAVISRKSIDQMLGAQGSTRSTLLSTPQNAGFSRGRSRHDTDGNRGLTALIPTGIIHRYSYLRVAASDWDGSSAASMAVPRLVHRLTAYPQASRAVENRCPRSRARPTRVAMRPAGSSSRRRTSFPADGGARGSSDP